MPLYNIDSLPKIIALVRLAYGDHVNIYFLYFLQKMLYLDEGTLMNYFIMFYFSAKQNLLSMWTNRIKSVHSKRHTEFIGRQENKGTIAELYKHMFEE